MDSIFEPSMIFISEADWLDSEKRDDFLNHLLDNLTIISEHQITRFYWTDELETLLWDHPQLPPWRFDKDWKNTIFPVIYRLFSNLLNRITIDFDKSCICSKEISNMGQLAQSWNLTLNLIFNIIFSGDNFFFCLGNKLKFENDIEFYHDDLSIDEKPIIIDKPENWIRYIDIYGKYWPKKVSQLDKDNLKNIIKIFAKMKFDKDEFLYNYEFSDTFIEEIICESDKYNEIIYAMVSRLLINQNEAFRNKSLKDEPVKGKRGERRIRVSKVCRIHYTYPSKRSVLFLHYYGEGEHDTGL